MNNKTRKHQNIEYAVVARRRGHDVWYCGKPQFGAPRTWSRGHGYARVRSKLKDIKPFYKDALELSDGVKNIKIIKITEDVTVVESYEDVCYRV